MKTVPLYDQILLSRSPPMNLTDTDRPFFEKEFKRILPKADKAYADNVMVTRDGLVYKIFRLVPQSSFTPSGSFFTQGKYIAKQITTTRIITANTSKAYIVCHDRWSKGYYHWMSDVLPRLYSVRDDIPRSTLMIPDDFAEEFIISSLKAFSFESTFPIPRFSRVKVAHCIVPGRVAPTGNYNETVIQGVRNLLLHYFRDAKNQFGDRIYISRAKAKRRKIVNESEVTDVLRQNGFQIVFLEDHSLSEQIGICRNTKYLVSNHGAGLTNMIFMDAGASVLEFRKFGDDHDLCYFSLASAVKLRYFYLFGTPDSPEKNVQQANLYVPIDRLKNCLADMLRQ
jgi:capsular polysaccharide biosynthesis protein